nr:hypothetical protein CFP56_01350 [Quercus suber]
MRNARLICDLLDSALHALPSKQCEFCYGEDGILFRSWHHMTVESLVKNDRKTVGAFGYFRRGCILCLPQSLYLPAISLLGLSTIVAVPADRAVASLEVESKVSVRQGLSPVCTSKRAVEWACFWRCGRSPLRAWLNSTRRYCRDWVLSLHRSIAGRTKRSWERESDSRTQQSRQQEYAAEDLYCIHYRGYSTIISTGVLHDLCLIVSVLCEVTGTYSEDGPQRKGKLRIWPPVKVQPALVRECSATPLGSIPEGRCLAARRSPVAPTVNKCLRGWGNNDTASSQPGDLGRAEKVPGQRMEMRMEMRMLKEA